MKNPKKGNLNICEVRKTRRIRVGCMVPVFLGLFLFHCSTTGPGSKESIILISTGQEVAIGESLDKDVESKNTVAEDPALTDYVSKVGQNLVWGEGDYGKIKSRLN